MFDVMASFTKKRFYSHQTEQVIITMVKKRSRLSKWRKIKQRAISLHGILPTHVYTKFKTD